MVLEAKVKGREVSFYILRAPISKSGARAAGLAPKFL